MNKNLESPGWRWGSWILGAVALAGIGFAFLAGWSLSAGDWALAAAALLIVPVGILFLRQPFTALLVWLLLRPFIESAPGAAGSQLHWIIHRLLLPAALGALLLGQWLGLRPRTKTRLGVAELAMLALLLLTLANIFVSSWDTWVAVRMAYDRLVVPFVAYLLVRLAVPNERQLKSLMVVGLFLLVTQTIIGLLSWYSPELLPALWLSNAVRVGRTVGTLQLPAAYSTTLVFTALLLYHHALCCAARGSRVLLLLAAGLAAFGVFFSFSRGSWFGGLVALGGLLFVYPRQTLAMLLAGGFILAMAILGLGLLGDELAWANERLSGEWGQGTAAGRVVAFRGLLEMTGEKPLFGWGYENHQVYSSQYLLPVGELEVGRRDKLNSHNAFLTLSSELGLPALFLYLFPAGWWLFQSLRAGRYLPRTGFGSWRLVAVLWLSVAHVLVSSSFTDTIRWGTYGTTLFWLALGLIATLVAPYTRGREARRDGLVLQDP